jgi:hypothetical protein
MKSNGTASNQRLEWSVTDGVGTAAMRTIAFLAFAAPAAAGTTPEAATESAAVPWRKLVDAGNYAVSWRSASSMFPQKVARFRLFR